MENMLALPFFVSRKRAGLEEWTRDRWEEGWIAVLPWQRDSCSDLCMSHVCDPLFLSVGRLHFSFGFYLEYVLFASFAPSMQGQGKSAECFCTTK